MSTVIGTKRRFCVQEEERNVFLRRKQVELSNLKAQRAKAWEEKDFDQVDDIDLCIFATETDIKEAKQNETVLEFMGRMQDEPKCVFDDWVKDLDKDDSTALVNQIKRLHEYHTRALARLGNLVTKLQASPFDETCAAMLPK